jgi:hypothetical protein
VGKGRVGLGVFVLVYAVLIAAPTDAAQIKFPGAPRSCVSVLEKLTTEARWRESLRTIRKVLLAEGFSPSEANTILRRSFLEEIQTIVKSKSVEEFNAEIFKSFPYSFGDHFPLPALVELAPFRVDVADWLEKYIKRHLTSSAAKKLLRYHAYWAPKVSEAQEKEILRAVALSRLQYWDLLARHYDLFASRFEDDPTFLERIRQHFSSTYDTDDAFILKHFVSNARFNEEDLAILNRAWIAPEEPVMTDAIRLRKILSRPGNCEEMQRTHNITFFRKGNWDGALVLIYLKGQLIGTLKLEGDPSMLALRHVQNSNGDTLLVTGGIYGIDKENLSRARRAAEHQGRWARLDLTWLRVGPVGYLPVRKAHLRRAITVDEIVARRKVVEQFMIEKTQQRLAFSQ